MSNFICQALQNKPLTIYGDGSQTRSFCFVDDLVNGLIKLMNSDLHDPVNIGSNYEFTIKQLAELVRKKLIQILSLYLNLYSSDDPLQGKPILEIAKKELLWEPTTSLDNGIDYTIKWFKEIIQKDL